ncbi:COUP transcription factor 2-like [Haliotis cracherodii]|uniref:COUP transcription factor 2-like n=1 Tax=Haliotis cracherodii TaxID=6455 RepID=UPI0039E7954B
MEVLYQPEPLYPHQTSMIHHQGHMQRLYVSPKDIYTCYSYDASPSRTPTPEQPAKSYSPPVPTQGRTLQSVLMGEVPAAYSHLTSQRCSSANVMSEGQLQTEPMDLSCKRSPIPHTDYSSDDSQSSSQGEFSLLRNLLSVGKSSQEPVPRNCESPCDYYSRQPVSGSTRVTLAKKNMFPVCSRVSDWLLKVVNFAKSIPEFLNLSHNDKVTLILNSWSRLLLLYMAESNFQFAVTPIINMNDVDLADSPASDEPTMKAVEGIQTFIRKCQHMTVEGKEYAFLRMLVLFNAGYIGLDRSDVVDQLNLTVQQMLQQHVRVTRPDDVMHYSRLLLCLPSLYGQNSKMIENLFCRHITQKMDMEVLLKEMLQTI